MGGSGSSTRRVTFEADENENITVVKGVRLSDSVIDRMKEPSSPSGRPQSQNRSSGAAIDEQLKKRIAEELALERARRDSEAQKRRLKQEQTYVRDEFGRLLERERISSNEHLTRAILRERAATEEERQKAQRFARQLEEKDRELKKHDAYYKEQLARLEERSAQFYKVTTEQYQKAADEVSSRYKALEQDEAIKAGCQYISMISLLWKLHAQMLLLLDRASLIYIHNTSITARLLLLAFCLNAMKRLLSRSPEEYNKLCSLREAMRYQTHPICADLQDKILQCYQQHTQETLSCSALASQYLRCVNHAKQSMLGRGG